jgi:Flp pilus assembly protein TadD
VAVGPRPGARADRLDLGPLGEAGKLREAIEGFRRSPHGAAAPILETATALGAPPQRRTEEAGRFRRQGDGLLWQGKLAAAITALRQAVRLDSRDGGSLRALGVALLRSNSPTEAAACFELAIVLEDGVGSDHHNLALAFDRQGAE